MYAFHFKSLQRLLVTSSFLLMRVKMDMAWKQIWTAGCESVGHWDLSSHSSYLFTPAVKSCFHLPPSLWVVTPLHQGVVMRIFECHLISAICRLVQPVEIAISQAAFTDRGQQHEWKHSEHIHDARQFMRVAFMHIGLPSSYSEKTRNVLSSFRFLLNSMERSLISLDVLLISLSEKEKSDGGEGKSSQEDNQTCLCSLSWLVKDLV